MTSEIRTMISLPGFKTLPTNVVSVTTRARELETVSRNISPKKFQSWTFLQSIIYIDICAAHSWKVLFADLVKYCGVADEMCDDPEGEFVRVSDDAIFCSACVITIWRYTYA